MSGLEKISLNDKSPVVDIFEWIMSHSLMTQYFIICGKPER